MILTLSVLAGAPAAFGCSRSEEGSDAGAQQSEQLKPGAGQVIVTGLADRVVADDAQSPALVPPFTISARERGLANLTIENARAGGQLVAINWNSGTPLPITGSGGGLDLAAAHVEVDGAGVTWSLDGPPRVFLPGSYRASGPVGVGTSGMATPREGVDFQADRSTLLTARGGTVVRLTPRQLVIEGPGTVTLSGQLQVRTPEGEKAASRAELRKAPFKVTLVPVGHQVRVEAILQGPVTSS